MILISCVDNSMGLRFNGRRCSRDREVCRDILERVGGEVWLRPESAALFRDFPEARLHPVESLADVPAGAACFWEMPAENAAAEEIMLYLWNRDYPSDEKFQLPAGDWHCTEETEFSGFSHPEITLRRYEKGESANGEA